jgi:hypothetical protein
VAHATNRAHSIDAQRVTYAAPVRPKNIDDHQREMQ